MSITLCDSETQSSLATLLVTFDYARLVIWNIIGDYRHQDEGMISCCILNFLLLNMQVIRIESHEADDVVATLVGQVLERGYRVVIASPDKDFKQLISEDVQIVMPMPELNRWSFYTLKHYVAQYNCDPRSDLSLSKCDSYFGI